MNAEGTRPLIGVCAALEHARWGVWDLAADVLPRMYVDAVQRAGGAALLLPVDAGWAAGGEAQALIEHLDGLLLAGGADIDPASYGAQPHERTAGTVPQRDAGELALLAAARQRDLPVLGICRGLQLINIATGGTLDQHVPDRHTGRHLATPGSFEGSEHAVELTEGSLIQRIVGDAEIQANSHHHQGIDELGDGLTITARSTIDNLPEAIEDASNAFLLGVQWHPEADSNDRVVPAFLAAARKYRG